MEKIVSLNIMIIEFDKIYKDIVCENVPLTTGNGSLIDPWDGEKPHAKDGFVELYCMPNEKDYSTKCNRRKVNDWTFDINNRWVDCNNSYSIALIK